MAYQSLRRTAIATFLIFGIYGAAFGQRDSIYRLPAGTRITLKLGAELNSRVSTADDTFIAVVARPVVVRDVIVVPLGTNIDGRVTGASPAAAGGKAGKLELSFVTIRYTDELLREIDGALTTALRPERGTSWSALSILGGAGVGALLGGLTGSGRNVLIGTGVGAGAGTGIALARRGKDVKIAKNVEFEIELKRDVILPVLDY
ncbi:MAG: hypothetical protein ABJA02_04630 [Acidobacteriota bacterium]